MVILRRLKLMSGAKKNQPRCFLIGEGVTGTAAKKVIVRALGTAHVSP